MSTTLRSNRRDEAGFLPLDGYGAIGEGRSVALTAEDGGIDWWCVPNMDSPPLFDRLLIGSDALPDGSQAGHFSITPTRPFRAIRNYRPGSNVLETRFITDDAEAMLTESLNSGPAGRLPWAELARRIDVLRGTMEFAVTLRFGHRAGCRSPYMSCAGPHVLFHVGGVLGAFLYGDALAIASHDDNCICGTLTIPEGGQEILAIVAGADEPLVIPDLRAINARIDVSDREWRDWSALFDEDRFVIRHALALKLLLYSPSGAIAAAATSSLPERIGGEKNYDYRLAWVRDAGYAIASFLQIGAEAEAKAALTWLLRQLCLHGAQVCFLLDGGTDGQMREFDLPGYRGSRPVVHGNRAADQHQHGIYGDIFETVAAFTRAGNIIDARSAETLSHLADECADRWREKDAGIWELPEEQHYTMSKISCWQALSRAVELADTRHLPTTCRDRWDRERARVAKWIDANCWDEAKRTYIMYPGSERLDASIALAVRFGFERRDRLALTLDAIDRDLGTGGLHYRYGGMEQEEGCFLACSFWMVEARALLGQTEAARHALARLKTICGEGILPEMIDPSDHSWLGNLPQGLSHLAALQAAVALN
ncbi:glycoside hydrolase family 15 protein [Ketogulonicigenium vulgare]|uniref:Glycoside hydrolase 15-related protein n=1 Tax=Ketogulonicigenium vulgare (strain WSH-001) TaxID=759362 RepID=F9Y941_KETVW|nr:glycoside hydrolase family 15 protein [Ketogulonicigenium vulgare]ADO43079.1 glycoside hydrolase 15-like protein [Ketogulonicigenium vulgare Y25]AEM41258.1 Glycoside hydrolase 15-related protein [Ketogulonicigenium vulgare WSH-001]ALJ81397.1 glycoside hydrolase family 15 [Ketogulonicigenium vulgare]ANW34125.1 glycoside hydrolase family 15 [Ketogulonicigenium vulgare]AOZ54992.1 glycosyl hydrolases 15 family protein [Ketogulonicigenium vulgare]